MKIAIDLGHGVGQDRGAVGIINEETIINSVGRIVIEELKKRGHFILDVRPLNSRSVSESLSNRVNSSNNFNPDIFISIHANAGGGKGSEIFTYKGSKIQEALNILSNIEKLGFVNRGIKDGSSLFVIRNTVSTAMLIEICFVDTSSDVNIYNTVGPQKIAEAIINGILGNSINYNNTGIEDSSNSWITRFQKEINLQGFGAIDVDGIAGPKTLGASPMIKIGAQGNITRLLQEKLGISVDGIFGPNTKKAVELFQKKNGLVVDGIIGVNTWSKLLGL
ncbi:MAG: N-acetylmuramoyl-L-alanine amidase [Clostridiales bacterium]|nr:N-acetylmuramoyl-L-alanine amidase [Clostridiales bacterium]